MNSVAKLIVQAGLSSRIGDEILLEPESTILGRATSCHVVIPTSFASRRHAQIIYQGQNYWLQDLGSKNGTLLNNQPVTTKTMLTDGAEICIGEVILIFADPDITRTFPSLQTNRITLRIDTSSRDVWVAGKKLKPRLSVKQFTMLQYLYQRTGEAVSKDELASAVWPEAVDSVYDYQIDKMVSRLRERIGKDVLETVWGYGYKLTHQ